MRCCNKKADGSYSVVELLGDSLYIRIAREKDEDELVPRDRANLLDRILNALVFLSQICLFADGRKRIALPGYHDLK